MDFLDQATRVLFFTGKGGVGKTTMACAAAVQLAERDRRVLLVSTDPASNLDDVFGQRVGTAPTVIAEAPGLSALNIDPETAAREYRERMVGPYRGVLPEAAIQSMEEQFSGSCTTEIAAFDEFARLLGDAEATRDFDHVVFDTAPTGHTLRLLTLPSAWSGFMQSNTTGASCLGPLAGLQDQQWLYLQTVRALRDGGLTTLMLVVRPEASALREASRTRTELRGLGIENQRLIINGVFGADGSNDPLAAAMHKRVERALAEMPAELRSLEATTIPLAGAGLVGVDALRAVGSMEQGSSLGPHGGGSHADWRSDMGLLVDDLAAAGRGVILTMGKGGVGKTTIAAAIAVSLAERGLDVHLSTTDPAAHLAATLAADTLRGLTVSRIDPARETASYTEEVMRNAGADLDAQGKALLEEDLRSPCTEEVAVFRAFARTVAEGDRRMVVLDTAPTGHTILLLDAALSFHREVTRQSSHMPKSVEQLLPRLRDPAFTRVLIVTLPESTPIREAARLQEDLRRAEIEPFAWIVNQCLTPVETTDPVLGQRRRHEAPFLLTVQRSLAARSAMIRWRPEPATGVTGLRHFLAEPELVPGGERI